ncbi:tellurite resistance protein TerB [Dongia mobilis]|uniref:Tellurite resistance protein TerB n=1 Tax=Dongia mobilis TaxID=578943 RepID=A0A4R6WX04_9PROT|nr:tellurite resistance TerB family protein [Dongia mobilis]TDQ82085.1 tellurite resistance protein TerB [Dongia mobilis]
MASINHHTALIYTMILVSAADRDMTDAEMQSIGDMVGHLPVFRDFDKAKIAKTAASCVDLLNGKNGLDGVLKAISDHLPERFRETAYALACDVAAADGKVSQEEARMLDLIRYELKVGKLVAAAIERGARARHMTL